MKLRRLLAAIMLLACGPAAADFSFALMGDTPYGADEETSVVAMLREIGNENIAFVVHVGDIKDGWTSCGDPVLRQRKELFAASRHALVYIPGDNEWTDCWRRPAGRYDPLERLGRLRQIFFSDARSLGVNAITLTRQSDTPPARPFPEHARWTRDKVVFASFNLPGSDNNLGRMPQEHAQRDSAAREWLRQAFEIARRDKLAAVVVLMHANPFTAALSITRGFTSFVELLAEETARFDGEVLLVHGDTHHHRIDQPVRRPGTQETLANLTRVEVFGSPFVNWVRVRAEEVGGRVKFEISPGR